MGETSVKNGTSGTDYTYVRVCVSVTSFSILVVFNLFVNGTILLEERLRSHARFVLVFHLLVSALIYFGMSSIFYCQIYLNVRPTVSICATMVTVLITSASNILLTITAMALDRYFAVCHPMRYNVCCTRKWPWLAGLLTWGLALIIPLSLLPNTAIGPNGECGRGQLKNGEVQKISLISLCTLLILFSYVKIWLEGQRMGVWSRRNSAGCKTIALHGTQLAVYIFPNFVNFVLTVLQKRHHLQMETKELFAVVSFAFFSLAQCFAPVVYGLRKEELLEQLENRFPFCSRHFKSILGWTIRTKCSQNHSILRRERTLTTHTILSLEISQTPEEELVVESPVDVNNELCTTPMLQLSSAKD